MSALPCLHAPNDAIETKSFHQSTVPHCKAARFGTRLYRRADRPKASCDYRVHTACGVNDQVEHAHELAALLKDYPCKINLIPFNDFPNSALNVPAEMRFHVFGRS